MGLTAAVPITIDYDLDLQRANFSNVLPFVGPPPGPSPSPPAPAPQMTYTVVPGDYLVKIAQQFYGDGSQWRKIYDANRDVITDPDLIYPGQVLFIPP